MLALLYVIWGKNSLSQVLFFIRYSLQKNFALILYSSSVNRAFGIPINSLFLFEFKAELSCVDNSLDGL